MSLELKKEKHIQFVENLDNHKDDLRYWLTAHLRMSGLYWGLTSLFMLNKPQVLDREEVIQFVNSCWDEKRGAFGAHPGHDGHLLYTLSAVQILLMEDALDRLGSDRSEAIVSYVKDRQLSDGSFTGDEWGEIDTRFAYVAVQILSILGKLDAIDTDKLLKWLAACQNFDGGFGLIPGGESHAAQALTVIAALSILGRLDVIDSELASVWLSERQTPDGGLNGRPEKLPDVCYSWWVLSSLAMLGHINWIDGAKLRDFILAAQDTEEGGIADREGDEVDVFHTVFGLAGLSLLGYCELEPINPVYCLPESVMSKVQDWPGKKAFYKLRNSGHR